MQDPLDNMLDDEVVRYLNSLSRDDLWLWESNIVHISGVPRSITLDQVVEATARIWGRTESGGLAPQEFRTVVARSDDDYWLWTPGNFFAKALARMVDGTTTRLFGYTGGGSLAAEVMHREEIPPRQRASAYAQWETRCPAFNGFSSIPVDFDAPPAKGPPDWWNFPISRPASPIVADPPSRTSSHWTPSQRDWTPPRRRSLSPPRLTRQSSRHLTDSPPTLRRLRTPSPVAGPSSMTIADRMGSDEDAAESALADKRRLRRERKKRLRDEAGVSTATHRRERRKQADENRRRASQPAPLSERMHVPLQSRVGSAAPPEVQEAYDTIRRFEEANQRGT